MLLMKILRTYFLESRRRHKTRLLFSNEIQVNHLPHQSKMHQETFAVPGANSQKDGGFLDLGLEVERIHTKG